MDWRIKCLALRILDVLPRGGDAHRALQKRVTGRYLLTISDKSLDVHRSHVANYLRLGSPGRALEFGAGAHLLTALMLSAAGAEEVSAFDIERLATPDRVNHVIRRLRDLQIPGRWSEVADLGDDLRRRYRISYRAPADARATALPAGSVDFFYSTSTLEHIREPDIASIVQECVRIGSPRALMSFAIDYKDHYAGFDRSLSRFNFYRYSDPQWAKYNPSNHYQNRLRHCDYLRLFGSLGISVLEGIRHDRRDPGEIAGLQLAERFRRYETDDLLTGSGRFLLAPPSGTAAT